MEKYEFRRQEKYIGDAVETGLKMRIRKCARKKCDLLVYLRNSIFVRRNITRGLNLEKTRIRIQSLNMRNQLRKTDCRQESL